MPCGIWYMLRGAFISANETNAPENDFDAVKMAKGRIFDNLFSF